MRGKANVFVMHDGFIEVVMHNKEGEESGRAVVSIDDLSDVKSYHWHLMERERTSYAVTNKTIEGKEEQ